MRDLISRQAAIDALGEKPLAWTVGEYELGLQNQWQSDVDTLKDLPSAQPEIIRCKDCKYAEYIDDVKTFWCTECGQGRTVAPNDFCSYAERRE